MAGQKKSVDDYTKRELYELAKKRKVPRRGTMKKAQLYEALGLGSAAPAADLAGLTAAPVEGPSQTSAGAPAAAPAPSGEPYVERGAPIPDTYGDDKLTALVRDPQWVFCYWELEGGACQKIIDERGQDFMDSAQWVIRVHNLTISSATDAGIDAGARNWYLKVDPATRYRFEIGVVSGGGEFIAVASSGQVVTPREGVSDEADEEWMLVREDLEKLMAAMGGVELGVSGSALARRFELPTEVSRFSGDVSSPKR